MRHPQLGGGQRLSTAGDHSGWCLIHDECVDTNLNQKIAGVVPPSHSLSRMAMGQWGEDVAADYLDANEISVLDRNWRCRHGELDIVAFDPDTGDIVAVEVKTRRSTRMGLPMESVTPGKVARLRRVLGLWLAERRHQGLDHEDLAGMLSVRIDVISIVVDHGVRLDHLSSVG